MELESNAAVGHLLRHHHEKNQKTQEKVEHEVVNVKSPLFAIFFVNLHVIYLKNFMAKGRNLHIVAPLPPSSVRRKKFVTIL